jgi:hypothetical protein
LPPWLRAWPAFFFAVVAATSFDCDLDVPGFDTGALVAAGFVAAAFVADVFGKVDLPFAVFGGADFGADTLVDGLDVAVLIVGFLVVAVAGFSTVFAGLVLALVGDSAASAFLPVTFDVAVLRSTVLVGAVPDFALVVDFLALSSSLSCAWRVLARVWRFQWSREFSFARGIWWKTV